jgi:hypothetical protein
MKHHVDAYLVPRFGAMAVEAVSAEIASKWIKTLPHLKAQTLRHLIATLQLVLGVRFGKGKISYPPISTLRARMRGASAVQN